MPLSNREISELLARAAEGESTPHRRRALSRAARGALFTWEEEAASLLVEGRPLTELVGVGPWLATAIGRWIEEDTSVPEPPELRRGFLTLAQARATLVANPDWRPALRADLQMHTTYSDGRVPLREMVAAAAAYGYEFVAVTDHSKGLPIAGGMDEATLLSQGDDIARLNEELRSSRSGPRVLRSIEMNLSPEGEGDMDEDVLRGLDLVLGAFHSKLRVTEDQTERYLAALRNPTVHVLAHPRGRRFGVRLGLTANWERVVEEAVARDRALEIDAFPDRQDLDVERLQPAREAGVRISIGTDAHHPTELRFIEFGLAIAIRAGIPRERILNFMPVEDVLAWAAR